MEAGGVSWSWRGGGVGLKTWGDDFLGYTLVSEEGFMISSMIRTNVEISVAKESFFSY
jgi:hypothetical protein